MKKNKLEIISTEKKKPGRNGKWKHNSFSLKVTSQLNKRNLRQVDLAKTLGVSSTAVSRCIYGDQNNPKLRERICVVLGIKDNRKKAVGE